MKNECDIIQDAQDQVNAALHEQDIANEQIVDNAIEDTDGAVISFIRKFSNRKGSDISKKEFDEYFGSLSERDALSQKINLLLKSNPDLAETIIEEFKFRLANPNIELSDKVFANNKLVLRELPVSILRGFNRFTEGWINSNGKDWNNFYYRNFRIPFGLPRKLRFEEPTGAYNDVFIATQRYADIQGLHIQRFNHGETADSRGMHLILEDVKNTYKVLKEEGAKELKNWLKGGFINSRTEIKGRANLIRIFTDMMRGRIVYVSEAESKNMIENKETGKKELQWNDGAGLYIYQHWAPTGDSYKSTGDAVFRWQKPIKFAYNPKLHSEMRDHRGDLRYDTMEYIKNSLPLSDKAIQRLLALKEEARAIDNMFYDYVAGKEIKDKKGRVIGKTKGKLAESFDNIIDAVMMHFPNKTKAELKEVFEDKSFDSSWSKDEKETFKYLEEQFTQYSLSSPFLYDGAVLDKKDDHFPYMFMPETYIIMLGETINNIKQDIKSRQRDLRKAKGIDIIGIEDEINALESSVRHMEELKETMLTAPEDVAGGNQMVARTNSKYFKHISNAFDMLKARTDDNVYLNYLEHNARAIERNNLTAELIKALSKTQESPVQEAMINLYKRTIGRMDTRSKIFGMDISDENLNPTLVRALRALRKWDTLLLSSPVTAMRNYMGHIEKFNKVGLLHGHDALKYVGKQEIIENKNLQKMLSDAGINVFDEFFTHAIVKDLEQNEIERETIQGVVDAFVKYYSKTQTDETVATLRKEIAKHYKKAMDKSEFLLTAEETKAFSKKMKQEKLQRRTNKVVNLAIANQYRMNESIKNAKITNPKILAEKGLGYIIEGLVTLRGGTRKGSYVMTEAEKELRTASFILGIWGAQKRGFIKEQVDPHEILPEKDGKRNEDYYNAIKYGRMATNLMFDFGMSKQHVGEISGSSAGQFLGQFTVWRTQKAGSDLDLLKFAAQTMDSENTSVAILKAMGQAIRWRKRPAKMLQKTNPDVLALRRFIFGQFMIEGALSGLYLLGSFLPPGLRQAARLVGAHKAGAAGSDVAAWFWMPLYIMAFMTFGDEEKDDLEKLEQSFSYMLRKIPVAGLGVGFVYDMTALFFALLFEQEEIAANKAIQGSSYLAPIPGLNEIKKATLQKFRD